MIAILGLASLAIMAFILYRGARPMHVELMRFPGNEYALKRWRAAYDRVPLDVQVKPVPKFNKAASAAKESP